MESYQHDWQRNVFAGQFHASDECEFTAICFADDFAKNCVWHCFTYDETCAIAETTKWIKIAHEENHHSFFEHQFVRWDSGWLLTIQILKREIHEIVVVLRDHSVSTFVFDRQSRHQINDVIVHIHYLFDSCRKNCPRSKFQRSESAHVVAKYFLNHSAKLNRHNVQIETVGIVIELLLHDLWNLQHDSWINFDFRMICGKTKRIVCCASAKFKQILRMLWICDRTHIRSQRNVVEVFPEGT